MAKTKAEKTIKKSKTDIAKNIRDDILRKKDTLATDAPTQNVETAQNIAKVAAAIEMMSDAQNDTLLEILKALEKIPETLEDQEKQASDNLEKLVTVIVELEEDLKKAEDAGDTDKADKLRTNIGDLKGEANKQLKLSTQSVDAAPKTFLEGISRAMGVEPTQLREQGGGIKGLGKSIFKGTKDYVGSITDPDKFNQSFVPTVDERIQKEKEQKTAKEDVSSSLGTARKAEIAEKIKDVPDYLRVKVDPETGERYRPTKGDGRVNEMNESGEKNPRFDFGTTGRLVEEETGKGYDYGSGDTALEGKATPVATSRPEGFESFAGDTALEGKVTPVATSAGSSIFEGESGSDTATDTTGEEMLGKLDDIKESLDTLNTTLENKEMGGGGGGSAISTALGVASMATPLGRRRAAGKTAGKKGATALTKGGAKGLLKGGLKGGAKAARFLGPVGAAITLGMAAADAIQGGMADPEASTGQKIKNAGSALLNSFTFGFAGKSANEIKEEAAQKQAAEAADRQSTPGADVEAQARASGAPPGATPPVAPFRNPNRDRRAAAAARMEAAAAAAAPASAPIIMDNSQKVIAPPAASQPSSGSNVTTVRDTRSSHLRFQDRRAARGM